MNADDSFKGGFDGCVAHMQECENHSEASAKAICAKIAQLQAAGSGAFRLPDNAAFATGATSIAIACGSEVPDVIDFQFMPPGRQKVEPFVQGKPMPMTIDVTEAVAKTFAGSLVSLHASAALRQGDKPFTDFDHEDGAASSHPIDFAWGGDDPKTGGVRLRAKLTARGKAALVGGEYLRFSPQWAFDPKTFVPVGLDVNVGGFVNRAAFKSITPVLRAKGARQIDPDTMTIEELNAALSAALKPVTDRLDKLELETDTAQARGASTAPTQSMTELTRLLDERLKPIIDAQEAQAMAAKDAAVAGAKAAVQVHVGRGAIAPEDAASIEFWQSSYLANATAAEAQMSRLPGRRMPQIIRGAGSTQTATGTGGAFPEQRILAQAKDAKSPSERMSQLDGYLHTAAGMRDYEEYRREILRGAEGRFHTIAITK